MVGLRKGICYRRIERPYTRKSKFKKKGYVKAVPDTKISRYIMGEKNKQFQYKISLVSKDDLQIRDNAIESARLLVNRNLHNKLGPTNYMFRVNMVPHHALRENKMLGGAHADRLQSGMAHSFGKVIGISAQVRKGKEMFTAYVDRENIEAAKEALIKANTRLPGRSTIKIEPLGPISS